MFDRKSLDHLAQLQGYVDADAQAVALERKRQEEEAQRRERTEIINALRKENSEIKNNWFLKFLSQWAVLSGGTLTLLITFTQSPKAHGAWYMLFQISSSLLILAVVFSALQIFIGGKAAEHSAKRISGQIDTENKWSKIYPFTMFVPIVCYILAIILAWIFVDGNLRINF